MLIGSWITDSGWWGVGLAIIGIGVTVFLFRRGRSRKVLAYTLNSSPLVSLHAGVSGTIGVTIDGTPVDDVHLVTVTLANRGNVEIRAADFEEPVAVAFGDGVPLAVDLRQALPTDLNINLGIDGSNAVLSPLLLNADDRLTFTALVRNFSTADLHARVAGTKLVASTEGEGPAVVRWLTQHPKFADIAGTFVGAGTAVFVALTIGGLFQNHHTHAKIQLRKGAPLCGKVLRTDATRIVVQLKDGGRIRIVPTVDVVSIRDKSC